MYYSPKFSISVLELFDGEEAQIGSFQVKAFEVSHTRVNSLGYLIVDSSGHRVVISGDTRVCSNLEREVMGADIAVLEATYKDEDRIDAHASGHMTKSEAKAIGRKARRTILVHRPPEEYFGEISHSCRPK
jgi:ribonuclease BN (tRNA processing enzyme)